MIGETDGDIRRGMQTIDGWNEAFGIETYERGGMKYKRAKHWQQTCRMMENAARTAAAIRENRERFESLGEPS